MTKRVLSVLIFVVFAFSLSGCATARKEKEMEIQGLKNQVSVLEAQVQSKDEEIAGLKDALVKAKDQREIIEVDTTKKVIAEVKSRPNTKQIQIALNNAGYNPGPIDGKIGKATREAVRAFQRANNLAVDGKVGKKTWELLQGYLYKKIK
jgi:peptidoglycan hydrolase-like protein with peptidoglycan-binding domain